MRWLRNWLTGRDVAPIDEIRKGGIGHNEVVQGAYVIMTPNGLAIAPTNEEVMSNEVVIAAEVLEQMLAEGSEFDPRRLRVLKGADPEAKIIGARWELGAQGIGSRSVVLVYDRAIPETPILQSLEPRGTHPGEIGTGFSTSFG